MPPSRCQPLTVLIIQETVKHYRRPFFDRLRSRLLDDGIRLRVAYSAPNAHEASKGDNVSLPDSYGLTVPAYRPFGSRLLVQPLFRAVADADLVVIEQANRYLLNHWLLLMAAMGIKRVALWGHGRNRQCARFSVREGYKKLCLGLADWWFAYTTGTADYVRASGYDGSRITTVHNAIDTRAFRDLVASVSEDEKQALRQELGIGGGARLGLFCGSLYSAKQLPFLFESAQLVRRHDPSFELVVIGGGPDRSLVDEAGRKHSWVHFLGPAFARRKATAFALADVCLNPGLVGLGILDAFAARLPVFTTEWPSHAPEIEYLTDGVNGRITPFHPAAYADAVSHALTSPQELSRLCRGAHESGTRYTLEAMVDNFHHGLVSCLQLAGGPSSGLVVNGAQ